MADSARKLTPAAKRARDLRVLAMALCVLAFSTVVLVRSYIPVAHAWRNWFVGRIPDLVDTEDDGALRDSDVSDRDQSAEDAAEDAAARAYFVSVWGPRIDAFNEGYTLWGYGDIFAEAAYDYGIDPRFSAAIARVESSSGDDCFLPYNAWGWGRAEWPDWDTAIRAHAEGLADGYGYTLSYATAVAYNGATIDDWYNSVAGCMAEIWPTDEL